MSKRKILTLAMALCMVAILAIGGTLAYFTDTDSETNTFTVGKVDIDLVEIFDEANAKLFPGKQNAIQKDVKITLDEDSEDAWVWYEWLIPAALDSTDNSTGTNNIVHVNAHGYTWDEYADNKAYWPEGQTEALPEAQTWDHGYKGVEGFIGTETITNEDGVSIVYNKYIVLYHGKLSAGQSTTSAMKQVWLDDKVDTNAEGKYTYNGTEINYDFTNDIDIIVRAYGMQAEGFKTVYEAYEAYQAK